MCDDCRVKQREYSKTWQAKNYTPRPRIKKSVTEKRAARRDWYAQNAERERARTAAWMKEHPDRAREIRSAARLKHRADPTRLSALRVAKRLRQYERRQEIAASQGSFSPEALSARLSMYRWCWICKTAEPTHVDHVKPLSKGGAHILANLRPACQTCNLSKGSKWPFRPEGSG